MASSSITDFDLISTQKDFTTPMGKISLINPVIAQVKSKLRIILEILFFKTNPVEGFLLF